MMKRTPKQLPSRRSFLITASAACVASVLPFGSLQATEGTFPPVRWRGSALGAQGLIELHQSDPREAHFILEKCQREIDRLEDLFSLYRPHSALSRLNESGILESPDIQFLELLSLAQAFSEQTDGIFDITVQPLWKFYADYFAVRDNKNKQPSDADVRQVLKNIGYKKLHLSANRVEFERPGMAITLNGIAQGYITDCVKELLQSAGYTNVLLSLGEVATIGPKAGGVPWKVELEPGDTKSSKQQRVISLDNQAVATSGAYGSPFGDQPHANHLLNPKSGRWATLRGSISVVSSKATIADMYSTALTLLDISGRKRLLASSRNINAVYYSDPSEGESWFA